MSTQAIVLLVSVIGLAVLGVPLVWAMGLASLLAIYAGGGGIPLLMLAQRMFTGAEKYAFLAIFFFVLAGSIMQYGGLSKRLINFANSLVGHITGGTSLVCMVACTFFAAISGSSIATTAAIGGILYPELKRLGYPEDYAAALPAAGGVLGIVIPPSVTFVIYGTTTGASIGALLISGIIPGALGGLALCGLCYYFAKKNHYPKSESFQWSRVATATKESLAALLMPVIILGGIYSGVFTPTESAAVAAAYGLLVAVLVYREMDFGILKKVLRETARTTANVMVIVMSATVFSWLLTVNNIPVILSNFLIQAVASKLMFLLGVILLLLFLGMFMDVAAIILIIAPLLTPVAANFGIDPIHFGLLFVFTLAIGQATPPFGACLFVSCGISRHSIMEIGAKALPFCLALVAVVLLTALFPPIATFLPGIMI